MGKMLPDARKDLNTQGRNTQMRPSRTLLLAGTSLLAMGTALTAPRATAADTTISGGSTSFVATQSLGNLTLTNSGTLSGATALKYTDGTSFLINQGLIQGSIRGAYLAGTQAAGYVTLTTLVNTGSIVSAGNAIEIGLGNTLVSLANSGMIQGNLLLGGDRAVTIFGGTGGAVGTFTGVSGNQGTITSTLANLTLGGGNLLLNDNINVTGQTLVNSGAGIILASIVSVTGDYAQTGGSLALTGGELVVSGGATVTGATVTASLASLAAGGNYVVGDTVGTLIAAASGSYSAITGALTSGLTLALVTGTDTSNLLALADSDYIGGTLAGVTNTGSISSLYVAATGSLGGFRNETTGTISSLDLHGAIGTLDNAGLIQVSGSSGFNANGTIGTLNNSGTITGNILSLFVQGSIGLLQNQAGATIGGNSVEAILIVTPTLHGTAGTVGTLSNSGLISGSAVGIEVDGTVGLLRNQAGATIAGNSHAINVYGGITTLTNAGVLQGIGSAINVAPAAFVYGTVGLLENQASGSIVSSNAAGVDTSLLLHTLVNSGYINGGTRGILNTGAIDVLENRDGGTITVSNYSGLTALRNDGSIGTLTNAGLLASDLSLATTNGAGISVTGTIGQLINSGTILGHSGVVVSGTVGTLDNQSIGTIVGQGGIAIGVVSGGTIGTLLNSGYLAGQITVAGGGVGSLLNDTAGTLAQGLNNAGVIGTFTNAGTVNRVYTFVNTGGFGGNAYLAVRNDGTIGLLSNSGSIGGPGGGTSFAIANAGSIGVLSNSGTITASGTAAILNGGIIGTVNNSGIISGGGGGGFAFSNTGAIGTINNSGTLNGGFIQGAGAIGGINNSGTIAGVFEIDSGSLGPVINSGVIASAIYVTDTDGSGNDLTILGGTGGTVGTFTGSTDLTGKGTISYLSSAARNVTFASGALLLNDDITVANYGNSSDYRTLVNAGAALTLVNPITITGNYTQTDGELNIDTRTGGLVVAGAASITGGDVVASVSTQGNYIAGTVYATLVSAGAASDYAVTTYVNIGGLAGTVSGNALLLAATNDYIGGTLGSLTNSGTLANRLSVANTGTLGTFTNDATGTLSNGIGDNGVIGTLINAGTVSAHNAIDVYGSMGTLVNQAGGTVAGNVAVYIRSDNGGATIGQIVNAGTIVSTSTFTACAVCNYGQLGGLTNSGVIIGSITGGSPQNILTISGGATGTVGTFTGLNGQVGGINNVNDIVFASGNLLLNDNISASGHTIFNNGAAITLAGSIDVFGVLSQTAGTLVIDSGTELVAHDSAQLTGGTVVTDALAAQANYVAGTAYRTLVAGGSNSSYAGLTVTGIGVQGLVGMGAGNNLVVAATGDYIGDTLGSLTNTGTLTGAIGLMVTSTGSLGTFTNDTLGTLAPATGPAGTVAGTVGTLANSGRISGHSYAIRSTGSIGLIDNSGSIIGTQGIYASGTVGTIDNSGRIQSQGSNITLSGARVSLLRNTGTLAMTNVGIIIHAESSSIDTVANDGVMSMTGFFGSAIRIDSGTITAVINSGTISGGTGSGHGIYNRAGSIGTLVNSGTIANRLFAGITNEASASIDTLVNSGTLAGGFSGYGAALVNDDNAHIGTLVNSGTIRGTNAILSADNSTIGTLVNSGVIAGGVVNGVATGSYGGLNFFPDTSAADLIILGGDSGTVGTFTGSDLTSKGWISNQLSNVTFVSGSLLLNDDIDAGGSHTVVNSAATVALNTQVSIIGAYSQSVAGTLVLGAGAQLSVSGAASLDGLVTATAEGVPTANYVVGDGSAIILVQADGGLSDVATLTVTNTVALGGHLAVGAGTTTANQLLVLPASDYIGGTYGTLSIGGGTLLSAPTALYIAGTGTLGALANTGTIAGDITNDSARALTILGGGSGATGTLTGGSLTNQGTITSTLANVVLGGNLALNDTVNVGTGTLVNSGANLTLTTLVNVLGTYSQTTGGLELGGSGTLAVGGAASLTGGSLVSGRPLSATGNYLAGTILDTLVTGGAGSRYDGVTVTNYSPVVGGIGGIVSGDALLLGATGNYIGGTYGSLANTGTLSGAYGLVVGSLGTLDTFGNSGLISVSGMSGIGIFDRGGSLGQLDNSGTIIAHRGVQLDTGATVGTIANSGTITAVASAIELYNARAGLITNTGTIAGTAAFGAGIELLQGATVATISNAGLITGTVYGGNGIVNYSASTIGTVLNSGTIIAGGLGIGNFSGSASIGTLVNSGLISGGTGAILNGDTATIGTLINTGTLRAANGSGYALANHNGAVIGTLVNAGVIAGTVTGALYNTDTIGADFTIQGGDNGTVGTFTAWDMSSKGMIYNTLGNVTFTSGALLLHDDIYVAGHSVTNVAAALTLDTPVTITGAYSQLGGTLVLGTAGGLSVTGSAGLAGLYQVTLSGNATANYVAGDTVGTVVQAGGGVSYSGSLTGTALDGHMVLADGVTSNQLLALAVNDYIGGSYGTISVTGLLAGPTALYIAGTGSVGALANSGTIAGDIINLGTADLTISGGAGGMVGTLTGGSLTNQGTITSTLANVVLAGGSLLLNDAVNLGTGTLANAGAAVSLSTIVSVTGNYSQTGGTLALATAAELVVSGVASISGGTVSIARQSTLGNYVAGGIYGTLVAGGAGSSYTNVAVTTGSHALGLAGTVSNNGLLLGATGDYIGGSLGSLANSGTLAGHVGLSIVQNGQLGTFTNNGLISIGGGRAADNRGSIGLLENTSIGTITGTMGLYSGNNSTISTLANAGLISGTYGVYLEYAQVTLLTNSGTLEALAGAGVPVALNLSNSTINTLVNSGLVSTDGYGYGVNLNFATINTLVNQGTIASGIGIKMAYAGIAALENSGTLSGTTAIQNSYGVGIGTLVNSGTIMGVRAYLGFANASLGTLVNSGLIRGGIYNGSTDYGDTVAGDLTLQGGTGGTVGTFTGQDGVSTGVIYNSLSNLAFASGALLLNDDVRANAHTVSNTGAALTLVNTINLTGAYNQSAGTLVLNGAAQLNVIGVASITGQVAASVAGDSTANYLMGDTVGTLVQATGGLTYAGTFVNGGALDGHGQLTVGTSGSELLALATTDYIGAGYGTVSVTGLLTGPTALYIAGTGSLGALVNTGTIAGDIVNAGASTLSITGGTSGTVGTLTGGSLTNQGTITSTLANVVLSGGSLLLNDAVNVGTGTLANAGAAVALSTIVTVTGNYSQATGTLALATGAELVVSGAASISGGTVAAAALSDTGNYLAGSIYGTLVAGGAGSSYPGATVIGSNIPGMGSTVAGNNLALFATGNYIGAGYGSLSNSGTLAGAVALQVGGTGNLGTFRNSGLVTGAYRPILNYNTLGLLENQAGGTITVAAAGTLHQDTAAIYNGQFSSIGTITNAGLIAVANDPGDFSVYQIYAISNYGGTIGEITNSGTITGFNAIFSSGTGNVIGTIDNQGVISGRANINLAFSRVGLVTNSGTLSGYGTTSAGLVQISYATVGTIANSGLMAADHNGGAISNNYGTIGTVLNQGTIRISGSGTAINNYGIPGTVGTIVNSGTILADNVAIQEAYGAALGTVINTGTIAAGVVIRSYGNSTLGTVANSGLIRGSLMNGDATGAWTGQVDTAVGDLTLLGGTGTLVGTFTGLTGKGLIDNRVSNLSIAGGNLLLNDDIWATGHSVTNGGAAITLGSAITVTGTYVQSAGTLQVSSANTLQADSATVTGGQVRLDALGNYVVGQAQTVIGAASGTYGGATLNGTIATGTAIVLGSLVQSGGALLAQFGSDYVGGSLVTLTNSGTISSAFAGVVVAATGSVGTLINDGAVIGTQQAVVLSGIVDTLVNTGTVSAVTAIGLSGTVGSVLNTGVVRGAVALFGDSTTRFANTGTITGAYNSFAGISYAGLMAASSIGTLANSGTISAQYALLMVAAQGGSSIGTLINSGVIAGTIVNGNSGVLGFLPNDTVASDLTIQGGGSGTVGTFTGQAGKGLIQNKLSNLVFSGGSLLLNDDVDVTGHTAFNSGASLTLTNTIDVTGTYVQGSAGTLVVGKGGQMAVDGQATIAGQLRAGVATDNFLPGQQATLVTGSVGSDYSAATIASNLAQLALNNTIVNNAVVVTAQNYYIGGSLGADITNSGTVSAATAVYIASSATAVGTLVNSGVLAGNIIDDR
ncbi:beta strand repeat-containing protein, partial [Nitrospirillum viridazoti]